MTIAIDDLKAALTGGGARSNYFRFEGLAGFPSGKELLVKAAQLPASIVAPITVPFRGRQLQVAGDRTFEPWTITIINDNDFLIRNYFEQWMNEINTHVGNTGAGGDSTATYMRDAIVHQLQRTEDDNVVKTYEFKGIWPSNISAIDVSYDSENTIEEFTVELQVTYWTSNTTS
jgi:T4-like virus tail tube protein gp19.